MSQGPLLFIFDWDGTLCDSVNRIVTCLRRAATGLGLGDLRDEQFSDVIGLGLPQAIQLLYPDLDERVSGQFRESYSRHFISEDASPSRLFPHALEVIGELRARGHGVAVATGKSRRGLDRVLDSLGLQHLFDATRCADETASKPDPRMVLELLELFGTTADRALMVGDSEYDMEMALRAGVHGVGVSYGVHDVARMARHRPVLMIDCLTELLDWAPGSAGEHVDAQL